MLDTTVPLGEFLNEQLARVRESENIESDNIDESDDEDSPVIPEGYVFDKEASLNILACKDRYKLKRLLAKWNKQSLNARMKYDPKFATSLIFITDEDYEFSVDPEIISLVEYDPPYATSPIFITDKNYEFSFDPDIITLVESDPFYGYESETVVAP